MTSEGTAPRRNLFQYQIIHAPQFPASLLDLRADQASWCGRATPYSQIQVIIKIPLGRFTYGSLPHSGHYYQSSNSNQSWLFRAPPLIPSHCLYQLFFHCVLIVSHLKGFVKRFFKVFENFSLTSVRGRPLAMYHHYSTSAEPCQVLFSIDLKNFLEILPPSGYLFSIGALVSVDFRWGVPLLTMIVYHRPY